MDHKLSISKDEINQLPLYRFDGTIVVIESGHDALVAIQNIKNEPVLGFDTETRAAFRKGEHYDVSLLQLATRSHAYLFRLSKFKIMPELTALLSNKNIVKAGIGVKDDIKALQKLLQFKENRFIDLAVIAKEKKIKNFGLRALTAIFLNKRLSKKEKISNWEKANLTKGQIHYAACDAVVGFQIYHAMCD